MIASSTAFICDECVELCDDLIWIEEGKRLSVRIKIPPSTAYDDIFYDALAKVVSDYFPNTDFRYEFRLPSTGKKRSSHSSVAFSIHREQGSSIESYDALKTQVSVMARQLSVMTTRFVHEIEKVKSLNEEIKNIKVEAYEFLRENFKQKEAASKDLRAVMFLDISGFSKFSYENKQEIVDMLRGITPSLLNESNASEINMWGDAIVCSFSDANQAIASAARFIRHLSVEQLDARIGIAWGEVRIKYNEATGRRDIDGLVVDFAARLEPLAPLGGILLSPEFGGMEIDASIGDLVPVTREIKKDFAKYKVGDVVDLFEFRIKRN